MLQFIYTHPRSNHLVPLLPHRLPFYTRPVYCTKDGQTHRDCVYSTVNNGKMDGQATWEIRVGIEKIKTSPGKNLFGLLCLTGQSDGDDCMKGGRKRAGKILLYTPHLFHLFFLTIVLIVGHGHCLKTGNSAVIVPPISQYLIPHGLLQFQF